MVNPRQVPGLSTAWSAGRTHRSQGDVQLTLIVDWPLGSTGGLSAALPGMPNLNWNGWLALWPLNRVVQPCQMKDHERPVGLVVVAASTHVIL